VCGLGVLSASAQDRRHNHDNYENRGNHRGWGQQRRYDDRNRMNDYNNVYVVREYRYVRYSNNIYRETYRSTYTRNGFCLSRVLEDREPYYYNMRRDRGLRFNVFIRL
jgi:hypothetical protein